MKTRMKKSSAVLPALAMLALLGLLAGCVQQSQSQSMATSLVYSEALEGKYIYHIQPSDTLLGAHPLTVEGDTEQDYTRDDVIKLYEEYLAENGIELPEDSYFDNVRFEITVSLAVNEYEL